MQRQPDLGAGALHFETEQIACRGGLWQQQVQQLARNLHLRAAIGRGANHPAIKDLTGLQGKLLQGPAARSRDNLG